MTGFWNAISVAEDVTTAGSGAANAAYFAGRSVGLSGARRMAALLLALLCGAIAMQAVAHLLGVGDAGPAVALVRAPLLVASVAIVVIVLMKARR